MTAIPSSDVAIGRWMKGAETLMGRRSWALARWSARSRIALALLASAVAAGSIRTRPAGRKLAGILRARRHHLCSFREAGKSGRDHLLARLQAGGDHGAHVVLLRERHAADSDGVVVLDHVDERPVGAALDGGG